MKRIMRTIDIRSLIDPELRRVTWMTGAAMGWMLIPIYAFTSPDWIDLIGLSALGVFVAFLAWKVSRRPSPTESGLANRLKRTSAAHLIIKPDLRHAIWLAVVAMGWMLIPVYVFSSPSWTDLAMLLSLWVFLALVTL